MSLIKYRVDLSGLPADEKSRLADHLDSVSFNGLQWEPGFQSAQFFLEKTQDLSALGLPDPSRLARLN